MGNFMKYCIEDTDASIFGKKKKRKKERKKPSQGVGGMCPHFIMLKKYFEQQAEINQNNTLNSYEQLTIWLFCNFVLLCFPYTKKLYV